MINPEELWIFDGSNFLIFFFFINTGAEQISGLKGLVTGFKTSACDQYSLTLARESVDYIKPYQCSSGCLQASQDKLDTLAKNFKYSRTYDIFVLFNTSLVEMTIFWTKFWG